ncbi:MAG: SUMF1/EgtB/PvdO family nonheme iron enzyme [Thermoanaerobaculia bacterium]
MATATALDRSALCDWFLRNRRRSRAIFDSVRPEAYGDRPIALRNPICFYEGHLPAFTVNTLIKRGLGRAGVDAGFEVLFERGIDPEDEAAVAGGAGGWPAREAILAYGDAADRLVFDALASADIESKENPVLARGLAAWTILEHEPMHQETLDYMWRRLPYEKKVRPAGAPRPVVGGDPPRRQTVRIPAGPATLGASVEDIPFGWDIEFAQHAVDVPPFTIDVHSVTNGDFLEFVEAGGYGREDLWSDEGWLWRREHGVAHPVFWERHGGAWLWRGQWEPLALPLSWPVWVSHAEASAYARFRGRRLPTEAQYHRAAFGSPEGLERRFPWGDAPPDAKRGNFGFRHTEPSPAGSHPAGASAWGVHDLVGNGWEWTSTVFAPFPGFAPMPSYPQYSVDFFDGKHWVLKGASPLTAVELIRSSVRNWFRGNYPYVYAKFRCVS